MRLFALIACSLVREGDRWRLPESDLGGPCLWPYDPLLLIGQPIGQYHCPYCGSMVIAGMAHIDYAE